MVRLILIAAVAIMAVPVAAQERSGFEIGYGDTRGDACADAQQEARIAGGACGDDGFDVDPCTQCTQASDESWSCGARWRCRDGLATVLLTVCSQQESEDRQDRAFSLR